MALDRCPDLLVFDHGLVRQAPTRTLASGVADALAKWYEASVSSGDSSDGLVQQAVQMARVLRDQLLIDSLTALKDPDSEAWVRTAEASYHLARASATPLASVRGGAWRTRP